MREAKIRAIDLKISREETKIKRKVEKSGQIEIFLSPSIWARKKNFLSPIGELMIVFDCRANSKNRPRFVERSDLFTLRYGDFKGHSDSVKC